VDRSGGETPIAAPRRAYVYAWISPDGSKASLDIRDQESDIWSWDFARSILTRITFDPGVDQYGIWTPDGRQVAFAATREGVTGLYARNADGTGAERRLTSSSTLQFPNAISPDGSLLVFRQGVQGKDDDLKTMRLTGGQGQADASEPASLISTPATDRNAAISPDGKWLAYESSDSGTYQVFVQPFPDVRGGRWQISTSRGTEPVWSRDGKELFYVGDDRLMVVPVETSPTFKPGVPVALFSTRSYFLSTAGRNYDVAPDGKRFLMIKDESADGNLQSSVSAAVVMNWFEEVLARMPKK
jgi:serine/threonine-protein kinase